MTVTDLVEAIEATVDKHGLIHVVTALELMCQEKAEHLRANWQDEQSAKVWDKAAKAIYAAVLKIEPLAI
jgi:hypothetical protein